MVAGVCLDDAPALLVDDVATDCCHQQADQAEEEEIGLLVDYQVGDGREKQDTTDHDGDERSGVGPDPGTAVVAVVGVRRYLFPTASTDYLLLTAAHE